MMPVFAPRSARPELPRDWIPVQRFEFQDRSGLRSFSGPPRSTFTVSGGALRVCLVPSPLPVFDAGSIPLCGLSFSSKLSPSRLHPHTHADAPLLGFRSPTALDNRGRPYSPMALQSHRHCPSSGFPTLSTSFFALDPAGNPRHPLGHRFSRLRSWGSPDSPGSYRILSDPDRAGGNRVSSPRLSPTPRRARFRALSSLALRSFHSATLSQAAMLP